MNSLTTQMINVCTLSDILDDPKYNDNLTALLSAELPESEFCYGTNEMTLVKPSVLVDFFEPIAVCEIEGNSEYEFTMGDFEYFEDCMEELERQNVLIDLEN